MKQTRFFLLAVIGIMVCGCAPEPKVRILWPPPPSTPRLEFIGTYSDQYDFEKDRMGKLVDQVAGEGQAARFKSPFGIVADGSGRVFVSDLHWKNIRVYDFNAKHVDFFFKQSPLAVPVGMAMDSKGRIYVADAGQARVVVYGPDKKLLYALGNEDETFVRPAYIALNERLNRLYVSDGSAHDIEVFDLEGQHLFTIGERGPGKGKLFSPQGMAIDNEDRLYVCDQLNAIIQVFDADGNFLYQFGERGDQDYQFESPKDIAFDSDGNLHVVDGRRPHIMTYTPEGELLLVTGSTQPTRNPLGFAAPRSIYIDDKDRIYIADIMNKRFSVWQYLNESYLQEHPITENQKKILEQEAKEAIEKEKGEE